MDNVKYAKMTNRVIYGGYRNATIAFKNNKDYPILKRELEQNLELKLDINKKAAKFLNSISDLPAFPITKQVMQNLSSYISELSKLHDEYKYAKYAPDHADLGLLLENYISNLTNLLKQIDEASNSTN